MLYLMIQYRVPRWARQKIFGEMSAKQPLLDGIPFDEMVKIHEMMDVIDPTTSGSGSGNAYFHRPASRLGT